MAAKLNLDKLDYQIIYEMMETAEISYADLGKKLICFGRHHTCAYKKTAGSGNCKRHQIKCRPESSGLRCNCLYWHLP